MAKIQCNICGGMAECGEGQTETVCPYCGRKVSLRRLSSFKWFEKTDLPRLQSHLMASAAEGDADSDKTLALALCHLQLGNFPLARRCLDHLLETAPCLCEPYYYYAITLLNNKELEEITLPVAKQVAQSLKTAISMNQEFPFTKLLYAALCIDYYEANELIPPDNGWAILEELDASSLDIEESDFLCQTVKSNILRQFFNISG